MSGGDDGGVLMNMRGSLDDGGNDFRGLMTDIMTMLELCHRRILALERIEKARELALAAEFNQQVESAVQDDFTVKVYRDTAVVWFTLRIVGIRQGQRAELNLSYTDVWVMRDGRWQCVSTQSTRITPKTP